jgi:hypothetical protein
VDSHRHHQILTGVRGNNRSGIYTDLLLNQGFVFVESTIGLCLPFSMEIRLYRALRENPGPPVQPPDSDKYGNPTVITVCLERSTDPDSNNHTGYDYWGAYGESSENLDDWELKNSDVLSPIEYSELPDPVTFYPPQFSDATVLVRARDESGRFIPDDPTTTDVNEAWTKVVL